MDFDLNRHPLWTLRLVAGWFRFHLGRLDRRWRTVILPEHDAAKDVFQLTGDELRVALRRPVGLTATVAARRAARDAP